MINDPNLTPIEYFKNHKNSNHKQYDAMKEFFVNKKSAADVAQIFGYEVGTVYSMARDLKNELKNSTEDPYFKPVKRGRKVLDKEGTITNLIVQLRKSYLSVPEIKTALEVKNINVSTVYIDNILKKEGFARLPRREKKIKQETKIKIPEAIIAEKTKMLEFNNEKFTSQLGGILCFLPLIMQYGIDKAVAESSYPETENISREASIYSFLALKLSNIKRYSADDSWCMDRGMGLFAGVNILPKTAWFSSYSSSVTREMNIDFLKKMHEIWNREGLLSDTVNIDFTAIPYWGGGDGDALENNWSGKRGKALVSMLALLAQDPDSGIICYGDTTVKHADQNEAIIEFLDFHKEGDNDNKYLKYLVFDSKVTTYQNLDKLNKEDIKFITIRRRGANLVKRIEKIAPSEWIKIRVERSNGKGRNVKVYEEMAVIKGYDGEIRQVYLTGNGKIKPAIIITNDFEIPLSKLVRKYSKRWLIEKNISEHIDFFHFNRNSSGIVIKVDFDLTMSIFAHNVYRLFAQELKGYSHCEAGTIFNKFIDNGADIKISDTDIEVKLKRKRHLPLLLEYLSEKDNYEYPWLDNKTIKFSASTTT